MNERTLCTALIPTLQDGADSIIAIANQPDGSTVDRVKLGKTIDGLTTLAQVAPDTMKWDIQTQLSTLQDLQSVLTTANNRTLTFDDFKASGLRLTARCAPYATK